MEQKLRYVISKKRGGYGYYLIKGSYSFAHSVQYYPTQESAIKAAKEMFLEESK